MVRVQLHPFDPWSEISAHERHHPEWGGKFGATAVFVGTLRDFNQGHPVAGMTLEHYSGMTEKHLGKVSQEAISQWGVLDALVIHRYGPLMPAEPIVLVAVWSPHRDAAFQACRYIIDELKTRAPFWKHEETEAGRRWVVPE
ncbi:MAG: molybdenum cofactor biosynthesis protein MoaE [Acidiferrobacterales bacterium]